MALDPHCSRSWPAPRTRARCSTSRTRTPLQPAAEAPLPHPGRHPDHAHRRGRDGRRRRARAPLAKGVEPNWSDVESAHDGVDGAARSTRSACGSHGRAARAGARRRPSWRGDLDGLPDARRHRERRRARHGRQRHRRRRARRGRRAVHARARRRGQGLRVPVVRRRRHAVLRHVVLGQHRGDHRGRHRGRGGRGAAWSCCPRAASSPSWPTSGARRACALPDGHPDAARRHRRGGDPAAGRARARRACSPARRAGSTRPSPSCGAGATSSSPTATRPRDLARAHRRARMPLVYGGGDARRRRGAAVEEPGQRERQGAGVRRRAPRAVPQRDLRLGPARRRHPPGVHAGAAAPRPRAPAGRSPRSTSCARSSTRSWPAIHEVRAEGEGALAQLFDLMLFGDFVSLHMAAQAGIDPGPIPVLDEIKRRSRADRVRQTVGAVRSVCVSPLRVRETACEAVPRTTSGSTHTMKTGWTSRIVRPNRGRGARTGPDARARRDGGEAARSHHARRKPSPAA